MSGYCSTRFNYHLANIINAKEEVGKYKQEYIDKINEFKACFDARVLLIPEDDRNEFLNHMIWRSIFDCERNAVSTYARSKFSQKQINSLNKKDMIELLKGEGIDWNKDVPLILKHGLYIKKLLYEIEGKYNTKVLRTKVTCKAFKISFDIFYSGLLFEKYWNIKEEKVKEFQIINLDFEKSFN